MECVVVLDVSECSPGVVGDRIKPSLTLRGFTAIFSLTQYVHKVKHIAHWKEMFYLTTHLTHFSYGYMVSPFR